VGSGDSLLAGLVDGWLRQLDPPSLLRHAVACGVENALVWDAGGIDPASLPAREREVTVEPIAPERRTSRSAQGGIRPGSSGIAARR
jgi:fructose-1-phosphate kinase PfkB-like protein